MGVLELTLTLNWTDCPKTTVVGVVAVNVVVVAFVPPAVTTMLFDLEIAGTAASATCRDCVPAVLNVTLKLPMPLTRLVSGGRTALGSLLVKCTLPL